MITTFVHIRVIPEYLDEFIEACKVNHRESVKEPGNLRFDILQDDKDPCKFVLYEAYESEEASKAHKETPHYLLWRETVAEWMASPREGIKHKILCPLDRSKW